MKDMIEKLTELYIKLNKNIRKAFDDDYFSFFVGVRVRLFR